MSKIVFINPPWKLKKDNVWSIIAAVIPPIGLAQLASYLEASGHEVKIIDMNAENMLLEDLDSYSFLDYDFIGITATTSLINNAKKIVEYIRHLKREDTPIILGGVHPTVMPEECLNIEGVDLVVRNEGEIALKEIVERKDYSQISNISYRDSNQKIIHNSIGDSVQNLDELPIPAYHLLPIEKYRPAVGAFKKLPGIGLITSRGCPGSCTFCYNLFGKNLRVHSAKYVYDMIIYLMKNYHIKEFSFYDDTFTAHRKRVVDLCNLILTNDLQISWSCFARVDFINEEMLGLMKRAGCHQIMYGFESASEEILQNINKKADFSKSVRAVELTRKAGINIRAAFMLGNPGETKETLKQSLDYVLKMNPEYAVFNITTPYPGTEMYRWAKEEGNLLSEDWDHYDLANFVLRSPNLTPEEVKKQYKWMYRRFYLRPTFFLTKIKSIIIKRQFQLLFLLCKVFYLKLTKSRVPAISNS